MSRTMPAPTFQDRKVDTIGVREALWRLWDISLAEVYVRDGEDFVALCSIPPLSESPREPAAVVESSVGSS
jgi:hypothetical protein